MDRNDFSTDFYELISGSDNKYSRAYTEAVKEADSSDNAIDYLKNFIASIENVASKHNAIDSRICASKGNIRDFSSFDNIEKGLKFLTANKTPAGSAITSDLRSLYDSAEKYKTYYVAGYRDNNKLLMREYECLVYLLVTGLSMALSFSFDVTDASGTTRTTPRPKAYFGVTGKKIHDMAEELSKKTHAEYLEQLEKATSSGKPVQESVYTEANAPANAIITTADAIRSLIGAAKSVGRFTFGAIKAIKSTLFGIVPLIRGVIFLSYKRKADTILALDQNVAFLEKNIEILTNKEMDPKKKEQIIKKQKAQIEAYKKRAEKLRACLDEGEKQAATAIKAEDSRMKTPAGKSDDDFVLESITQPALDTSLYAEIMEKVRPKTDEEIRNTRDGIPKMPKGVTKSNVKPKLELDDAKIKQVFSAIAEEYKKVSAKDTIRLKPSKVGSDPDVSESKIGGKPFWPEGKPYPHDKDGYYMIIQINLAKAPNLAGFPNSGILQLFIDSGWNNGKVYYHEDISKPADTSQKRIMQQDKNAPSGSFYRLNATKETMYPGMLYGSDESEKILIPIINKHLGISIKYLAELNKVIGSKAEETGMGIIRKSLGERYGTRLGGYVAFTQSDPRDNGKHDKSQLLMQVDSEAGIMFGDCGVMNVMISPADLKAKKFNDILFHWDCC